MGPGLPGLTALSALVWGLRWLRLCPAGLNIPSNILWIDRW